MTKVINKNLSVKCTKESKRNGRIFILLTVARHVDNNILPKFFAIDVTPCFAGPRIIGAVGDGKAYSLPVLFQRDSGLARVSTALIRITVLCDQGVVTADLNLTGVHPLGRASTKLWRHLSCTCQVYLHLITE